jgi:cytoskeleton protein RodZ
MASENDGLAIGEVLKRTRSRRKLDIRTVELEIKIRTKYLRALENEEWETLPGPAYAKGFLRTYAQFLGLDGDALVDEYRRSVESSLGADQPQHFAEPVLERRVRPGQEPRGPRVVRATLIGTLTVLATVGAIALIGFVVIGLTGDSGSGHHRHKARSNGQHHSKGGAGNASTGGPSESQPVTLALVPRDSMEVCLLPGHGQPLIDSQTLISGAKQGPFEPPAENYRLDLDDGGAATVILGGKPHGIRSRQPASYAIDAGGIHEIDFKGGNCP